MTWALLLDAADAPALGALRREPGLEASLVNGQLWLRGATADDSLALRLRQLPAIERYTVHPNGELLAEGTLVPRGYLPQGKWLALEHWLPVVLPQAKTVTLPSLDKVPLRLVRDCVVRTPNLLITARAAWCEYAASAPLVRLQRWSFAANDRGEALVRGLPLPPLAGQRLVEDHGVAVEAGWMWSPAIEAAVIRRQSPAAADDLVLLRQAHQLVLEIVPGSSFVKASRSAARLTQTGAVP